MNYSEKLDLALDLDAIERRLRKIEKRLSDLENNKSVRIT